MSQDKKTIFISYGRDQENPQDVELVRKVKNDLEKEGFEVLMDDEQLRTSQDWEIELEEMIRKSDWILFFITPYSTRRPEGYCLNELAMSLAYKVPIAPVMVSYEVPPLSICRVQYLDLQALKGDDDYAKKLEEIVSVINNEKRLGFEGGHLKLLNELDPIKFETTIAKHIHGFTGREWVYDEVDRWLEEEENSRVLWIMAEAGFGKSAISTYLSKSHPSALGIHFCQYDLNESKEAREMLKVLIYQLSTQIEEYHKILQTLNVKELLQKSPEYIFTQLLLEPLQQIGKQEKKYFFVIDALDEAEADGKNQIVELIANRSLDLPSWLNIVITSRPEPELLRKLKKFNPVELKADDAKNRSDMEQYLSKQEEVSDNDIVKALIDKSEGNILYLKSIFELDMVQDGELTLDSIEQLPNSMEEFYLKYFERRFDDADEYEEKYLDFMSLLVAEEGMPELLVQDILEIREREYKKIQSSFGSLLEVDDGNLTFYHKSIYEWLSDYDKSGDYSADVELGREKFENFMDGLIAESYREEYLAYEFFNRRLVDRVYEQDKNLKGFFKLIMLLNNGKEKIDALLKLGWGYSLSSYGRDHWIQKAIELEEEVLGMIKKLYQHSSGLWIEEYTEVLKNLAKSYKKTNKLSEAIELEKESLIILKKLYLNNPERWAKRYTIVLGNLAKSYKKTNKLSEAIELEKESLIILKEFYSRNPKKWAVNYAGILENLAKSYKKTNKLSEAIELEKESLSIRKELYNSNNCWTDGWGYATLLNSLSSSYFNNDKQSEAIKIKEEELVIARGLYQSDHEHSIVWGELYTIALAGLKNLYIVNSRISEAIELGKESLVVLKKLHMEEPGNWIEKYTTVLNDLALLYHVNNKESEAIKLVEQSLEILKTLYQNNPDRWAEDYTSSLNNLASSYYNSNRLSEAIELEEQSLEIRKALYQNNPERWAEDYINRLGSLSIGYYEIEQKEKSAEMLEQALDIIHPLYDASPQQWVETYTAILNNLGEVYVNLGDMEKAIDLALRCYEIRKEKYSKDPEKWQDYYLGAMGNLQEYYEKIDDEEKAKEFKDRISEIKK